MISNENYVYKKEVDWSVLMEGFTLPIENQVVFRERIGHFLKRGESKEIKLYINGQSYGAKIVNVNNSLERRKTDAYQIRYTRNGELSQVLQAQFIRSYNYIKAIRENRESTDRSIVRLPDSCKEYMAIYTTEYDDSYVIDPIVYEDIVELKKILEGKQERNLEADFNYDLKDNESKILQSERIVKIRKLNKKIGDNLKLLYDYRCQICGKRIGEEYGTHVVEAHHIDYFVTSLNNDAKNQLIVCPNHHSIIHSANPVFDRKKLIYVYENGIEQKIILNKHL